MTQDEKLFLNEFMEIVQMSAEENQTSCETELTKSIIEYIVANGEALAPEVCECVSDPAIEKYSGRYKVNAFDFSESSGILDLFGTMYYEGQNPTLAKSTAQKIANDLIKFLYAAIEGNESKRIRTTNPDAADVMDMIKEEYTKKKFDLVRVFVLSNGFSNPNEVLDISDGEITPKGYPLTTEYHFWDMNEVLKAEKAKQNNQEMLIELDTEYQTKLDCIEVLDEVNNIKSYLTIMPALTLAKIYHKYKVKLIDKNVRNFLGGKIKVNKKMADTICDEPELFFSYNNGISSTAASVEVKIDEDSGKRYITKIRNWHIVNGGQTTSTIYNAYRKSRESIENLSKAFVSVKISELPPKLESKQPVLIGNIAKYANSQNSIKESDLSANAPFMLQLEAMSRKEWTPVKHTLWYFERLRGQFLTEKGEVGGAGTNKAKKFEQERPQNQRFNKMEVAKLEMAWMDKPFEACKGGEVCFDKFWKIIKDQNLVVDENYFHDIIAKSIIYKKVDALLKMEGNKGHASIIANYTLALLALRSQKSLDLKYIWENQQVQDDLVEVIKECIKAVSDHIRLIGSDSGKNPQTESKKPEFWNNIQNKTLAITIPDSVLVDDNANLQVTEEQRETINMSIDRGAEFWKKLSEWNKTEGKGIFSIMEKKKIDHIAVAIERGSEIKLKLAEDCERILRAAIDLGFGDN